MKIRMKRVLLIEDDATIVELLSLFLGMAGHNVKLAYDGRQGIDILKKNEEFDVVITDIQLPMVSGNEIARYMRKSPGLSKIRIVAITGYIDGVEKDLYDSVLVKPFNLKDLAQLVDES